MSTGTALLVGVVLLALNAFFVGAEFAVMSARRSRIEPLAEQGSRSARTVLYAMEHVTLMLACAQLGVTVCSTSLGVVAEPAVARLVEGPMVAAGLPAEASHVVGFTVAIALVVYLHVVVGEMVPKNLSVTSPERAAMLLAPPLVLLSKVLHPVIAALNWIANAMLRVLGVEPKDEVTSAFTAEEVASIVQRSQAEGVLSDDLGLLTGAIEFSEETAEQVMVPLSELVSLPVGCTPEDVEREVARTGFSRFPLVATDGSLTGYLHVKDVLYADGEGRQRPVPAWRTRALASVVPGDEVEDVLAVMQRTGAHLARVVQESGPETDEDIGVVFLEDILEELVGEVRDSMQRAERR
ncbi:CBS domain containing-hemolysin-like protein [Georgenia soli]|uniref:CBS domain containing-hemolysin-like protein n=1 Tax=Georgenia soli TaxID=638953 RepID=A0A2A9EQZ7_9MICO|nr:hemolysin family protein [Georgenia soli]PFG40675.1 CBS domain containing-hemolysin-like protein [Georgenia soli]